EEPPAPAGDRRRGVPARRGHLEGHRAGAPAGVHAAPDAGGLRHRRAAAHLDHPGLDRRAPRSRRGLRPLLVPRRRSRSPAGAGPHRDRRAGAHDELRGAGRGHLRRAAVGVDARRRARARDARRRARPVGVHQPRARLRPAARRGGCARLPDHIAGQRRADGGADAVARGRPGRGRLRPGPGQLRRLRGGVARAVVEPPGAARLRARPRPRRAAQADAALRAADRAGRGVGLRAVRDRPLLSLPGGVRGGSGAVLAVGETGGGGHLHRPRLPARVAAAGLLGHRRGRGGPPLRPRGDLLRALHRGGGGRTRAARPLDPAPARSRVLRRPGGAGMGRARLGALRALPHPGGDGRPRARAGAHGAAGAGRPRRQRAAAAPARRPARDRRRRPGAGRRLPRDAGHPPRAHPPCLSRPLRVAAPGPDRRRHGRGDRGGGVPGCRFRRGGPGRPPAAAGRHSARSVGGPFLPTRRDRRRAPRAGTSPAQRRTSRL
ncbi:MAG: polysaccharide biosynthesis protein, partial [uncultured Solirubrobacteraceae bacterium]